MVATSLAAATSPTSPTSPTTLFSLPLVQPWLENLAYRLSTNSIITTRLDVAQIWSISTSTGAGTLLANATDTTALVGITQTRSSPDEFYVAGLNFDISGVTPNSSVLWKLAFPEGAGDGFTFEAALRVPGMTLINGLATWDETNVLAADSQQGNIWNINLTNGDAAVVLNDPTMAAITRNGVNGVKVHRSCGGVYVYYTSTDASLFARIPVDPITAQAVGAVQVLARDVGAVDDFALRTDGSAFISTGVNNTVVRVGTNGSVEIVAEIASGTACQFGEGGQLYVTTGGSAAAGCIFAVDLNL